MHTSELPTHHLIFEHFGTVKGLGLYNKSQKTLP